MSVKSYFVFFIALVLCPDVSGQSDETDFKDILESEKYKEALAAGDYLGAWDELKGAREYFGYTKDRTKEIVDWEKSEKLDKKISALVESLSKKLKIKEGELKAAKEKIDSTDADIKQLAEKISRFDPSLGVALTDDRDSVYFLDSPERKYKIVHSVDALEDGVVALNLSQKDYKKIPPKVFDHTELEILLLSGTGLQEISDSIAKLEQLHTLDLAQNELKELPKAIGKLKELRTLDLGQNGLTELPEAITELEVLQTLLLDQNNFEDISDVFAKLGALKGLKKLSLWRQPPPG